MVKNSIRTVFIFLAAFMIAHLCREFSHLVDFLFFHSFMYTVFFVAVIIFAIWAAIKLDTLISKSRYDFQVHSAAVLLISLFFTYQMFASHFYSEQYLKESGLEKIEQLFELGEQELSADELRKRAEQIAVEESAYVMSLYGINPLPEGLEELEVLEFERSYYEYELVVGTGPGGETAQYYFTRDGLGFKISGFSSMH